MVHDARFQRFAGVSAILAAALNVACMAAGALAVRGTLTGLRDPLAVLRFADPDLLRWSMLFDIWGSYLLLVPLAMELWRWLRPLGHDFTTLWTICGLAWSVIGAIGATLLAAVLPPLMDAYPQAQPAERQAIETAFTSMFNAVYIGLWNQLVVLLGAAWWIGIGRLLRRERPALGAMTLLLGTVAVLDGVGRILELEMVFFGSLATLLTLLPIWTLWCGIELLRRPAGASVHITDAARRETTPALP